MKQNNGEALDGFIFGIVENPMDFLNHYAVASAFFSKIKECTLYVTGLTTLLTATLLAAKEAGVESLILMHYDRAGGKYLSQDVSILLNN